VASRAERGMSDTIVGKPTKRPDNKNWDNPDNLTPISAAMPTPRFIFWRGVRDEKAW
jgi:hypothetical protein